MSATPKYGVSKDGGSNVVASSSSGAPPVEKIQEFNVRVPRLPRKHHMMRFNASLKVDFTKWHDVKMVRENNMKQFQSSIPEAMPKFGAGSEYNRDQREEARRKKFGIIAKKYRPEAQPYILRPGGKGGKKFKGVREGGVSQNAAYYVFTQKAGGGIEAYPLHEWYNFQPIQRYNTLSAEEAEHEFGRRKKVLNYFSLMMRKRLRGDEEEEQDPDEVKVKGVGSAAKIQKDLQICETEEWMDSDDESDSDEDEDDKKKNKKEADDEDEDIKGGKKIKGKGAAAANKKPKRDVDEEAFEESDDGDQEGRELEYDTESSEDEPDPESKLSKDMKSVAEEDALRFLLTSDEEDDEEKNKSDESENDGEKEKKVNNKNENNKNKKKTLTKTKKQAKKENKASSDELSSNSSESDDSDDDNSSSNKKKKGGDKNSTKLAKNFHSAKSTSANAVAHIPTDRTASDKNNNAFSPTAKYAKLDIKAPLSPSLSAGGVNANIKDDGGIIEETLRRYLMRKPMTATELLAKFRNKKTGLEADRLVDTMTALLKKINPAKKIIKDKMYMSLNP